MSKERLTIASCMPVVVLSLLVSWTNASPSSPMPSHHPLQEMLEKDHKIPEAKYVPGEILIKIKKGSRAGEMLKRVSQTKAGHEESGEISESGHIKGRRENKIGSVGPVLTNRLLPRGDSSFVSIVNVALDGELRTDHQQLPKSLKIWPS